MNAKNYRLRELDFLRGLAIILVLLRHHLHNGLTDSNGFIIYIERMGWIGVDLFFVLSGFLVSGLLFKEYLKHGDIQPIRFLIRRGFKIYPIYYLTYILYLLPILLKSEFNLNGFLADVFFIQNYVLGAGYAYPASWSLAVEEHFYFAFSIFLWLGIKHKFIQLNSVGLNKNILSFELVLWSIMIFCLLMRFVSNGLLAFDASKNISMTHLRIDSLLAGVFIAYLFYFRLNNLKNVFKKYKSVFYVAPLIGLSWTPFLEPTESFFIRTIGYTMLYLSFGATLLIFLLSENINRKLDQLFSRQLVTAISKIGFCSYSIYIIHPFVNSVFAKAQINNQTFLNHYVNLFLANVLAIAFGMALTYIIERYFLKIRDKHFPNRAIA